MNITVKKTGIEYMYIYQVKKKKREEKKKREIYMYHCFRRLFLSSTE